MKIKDVTHLVMEKKEEELPFRVELVGGEKTIKAAGLTYADALMRVFSVSGLCKASSKRDLAAFILWNFDGSDNWLLAIRELSKR